MCTSDVTSDKKWLPLLRNNHIVEITYLKDFTGKGNCYQIILDFQKRSTFNSICYKVLLHSNAMFWKINWLNLVLIIFVQILLQAIYNFDLQMLAICCIIVPMYRAIHNNSFDETKNSVVKPVKSKTKVWFKYYHTYWKL